MVDQTPFTSMDTDFTSAFTSGVNAVINGGLSYVAGPLTATVVLWIIVQGILVMRGDIDTRAGLTRIIRVALVVGLVTSSTGYFSTYVQQLFITDVPSWAAQFANTQGQSVTSTPATFDNVFQLTQDYIAQIGGQLKPLDVVDALALGAIEVGITLVLVVTFAVYEFSVIIMGIVAAIGPILLIGYLFEATKGFTDRWIGSLVTYSILILLIDVALNVVVNGEKTYFRLITRQLSSNGGGTYQVPAQITTLLELLAFLLMGGFIILSLPALAASIGGGHAGGPGHAIMNSFNSVGTSALSRVGGAAGWAAGKTAQGISSGARRLMGAGPRR